MKTKNQVLLLLTLGILGSLSIALWYRSRGPVAQTTGRKVLFYQDSMHPWIKSDRPGKCTICAMDLTPICEGDQGFATQAGTVVLNSNNITVLGVQTEEVKKRPLLRTFRVAGILEANETRKAVVSAPARGRIDALTVDYAGVEVQEGQKLITMFSPELVQFRRTLLAARRINPQGNTNDLLKANVDSAMYTGDIVAPQSGVVLERNVYLGQYVAEGDRLLALADASVLWFRFDVYERQLPWFEVGQKLEVTAQALTGKVFPAVISVIDPALNEATRAVKVRADIPNPVVSTNGGPRRALRFGMYAEGLVRSTVTNVLSVPRSAVLLPGSTAYAFVDEGGGAYRCRRLKLGRQGDEFWEVLKGLEEGESVVTSGNVLIDAQAQFNLPSEPEQAAADQVAMEEPAAIQAPAEEAMVHPMVPTKETRDDAAQEPPSMAKPRDFTKLASEGRTGRMRAIMSPGAELQMVRREAILAELAAKATNAPSSTATPTPAPPPSAGTEAPAQESATMPAAMHESGTNSMSSGEVGQVSAPNQAQAPATKVLTDREVNKQAAPNAAGLTANQRQALVALVATSAGISQALAADDLAKYNRLLAEDPNLLLVASKEFGSGHRWGQLLQRVADAGKAKPAANLAEARKQFLPFSTAMVELTKQLRKGDPAFADLKVYHCPMAPKPGLWMQAKGPLRNPFYGAKMLTCGEEVAP